MFNLFYIDDWSPQIQSFLPNPDGSGGFVAETLTPGDGESYGFDGSVTAALSEAWMLQSSFGYNHTELTDSELDTPLAEEGDPIPFAPEWNFTLSAVYSQTLANDLTLTITPSMRAIGETFFTTNVALMGGDMRQGPYEIYNPDRFTRRRLVGSHRLRLQPRR